MIFLKSEEEVLLIKESAQLLGKAHAEVAKWIKPGVATKPVSYTHLDVYKRQI